MPYMEATFSNSIFYGNGKDFSAGNLDDSSVMVRNCLLKSKGNDDEHFLACLWDVDPLYYTVREDYYFDYRLQPESPAIGAADPLLTASGSRGRCLRHTPPAVAQHRRLPGRKGGISGLFTNCDCKLNKNSRPPSP